MEQSFSWETNSNSASQNSPPYMEPEGHYHVHKGTPLVHILSQMNLVHTLPPYFSKIQFNIIFPSMPTSPKILYTFLICPMRATCPANLILLDFIALLTFDEESKLRSPSLCSLLQLPLLPPSWVQIFSTPCSQTPSNYVLPLVWKNKLHTHTKQVKLLFHLEVFRQGMGRQTLNRMVESIPKIYSAPNFFTNTIFICYCCCQLLDLWNVFEGFISSQ